MNRLKKAGWTFVILIGALVIMTVLMLIGNGVFSMIFERPNWRRIYKDIGVNKGQNYPTEYVDTEFELDPEWQFTEEDVRNAWKNGVGEFDSSSGYMYILEVRFDEFSTEHYHEWGSTRKEGEVICYKCKIYQGKGRSGAQNWAADYTVSDIPFSLSMKKNFESGNWELCNYGYG